MYKITRSKAATDPTIVWEPDRSHSTGMIEVAIPVNRSLVRVTDQSMPVGEQVTYYRAAN